MTKTILTVSEFCRTSRWAIKPATVRSWCRNGCGGSRPPFRKIAGRYYIDAPEMERWLALIGNLGRDGFTMEETDAYIDEIVAREERQGREERTGTD